MQGLGAGRHAGRIGKGHRKPFPIFTVFNAPHDKPQVGEKDRVNILIIFRAIKITKKIPRVKRAQKKSGHSPGHDRACGKKNEQQPEDAPSDPG